MLSVKYSQRVHVLKDHHELALLFSVSPRYYSRMIKWNSESEFEVDGTTFLLEYFPGPGIMSVMKERFQVDVYESLAKQLGPNSNMMEVGIRSGASTALMAVLFKPRCLSAIELKKQGTKPFKEFLETHPDGNRIKAHFGCDQGNVAHLSEIVNGDFGGEQLDIVADDASHQLAPSTTTFNYLFPRLRPGGIYVLEDWSWEHYAEATSGLEYWEELVSQFGRLTLKMVLACAYAPDVFASLKLQRGIAVLQRGPAELEPAGFDLDNYLGTRGKGLLAKD